MGGGKGVAFPSPLLEPTICLTPQGKKLDTPTLVPPRQGPREPNFAPLFKKFEFYCIFM